jgi:regulatory protein
VSDKPTPSKTEIAAVRLLARREHSTRELKRKLQSKGHAAEEVERVVDKLAAKRLVSDERFAESFIAHHGRRGHGPLRIRAELRQQGASDEVIEAALANAGIDWAQVAAEVRRRKFGHQPAKTALERAKQARFLQYRGFSADQIRAALSGSIDSADTMEGFDPLSD